MKIGMTAVRSQNSLSRPDMSITTCSCRWPVEIVREDLLYDYRTSTGQWNDQAQDLRNALVKLLPPDYLRNGSRITVGEERKRTWTLPSLAASRAHFTKLFKMVDDWPDDE